MNRYDMTPKQATAERESFVRSFAAAFLAQVAVQRYASGRAREAADNLPAEDAVFCAERAWAAYDDARWSR